MMFKLPGRSVLALLGGLFVSGCAVPVPIQVASWAIDGISYMVTQKSLADHGISLVAQKDCAVWRAVQGKNICDEYDDAGTVAVAALDAPGDTPETQEALQGVEEIEEPVELAMLETGGGEAADPVATPDPVPVQVTPVAEIAEIAEIAAEPAAIEEKPTTVETAPTDPVQVAAVVPEKIEETTVAPAKSVGGERILIPGQRTWSDKPGANMYYVIGSFQNRGNAKRLVKRHKVLGPSVMASRVKGVETYRVAVGPFTRVEQRTVQWTLKKSGIRESWAISIDHSQWMIAGPTGGEKVPLAARKVPVKDMASLPDKLSQNIRKSSESIENKQTNISSNSGSESVEVGTEAGLNIKYDLAVNRQFGRSRGGIWPTESGSGRYSGPGSLPFKSGDQIGRAIDLA